MYPESRWSNADQNSRNLGNRPIRPFFVYKHNNLVINDMNRYPSEAARGWYSEEEQGTNPFQYHSSYAYRDGQKFSVETVDGFKSKI